MDDCERAVRHLCGVWAKEKGYSQIPTEEPSFIEFLIWMQNNHRQYLDFRARGGATWVVNRWFDQEFQQTWKN